MPDNPVNPHIRRHPAPTVVGPPCRKCGGTERYARNVHVCVPCAKKAGNDRYQRLFPEAKERKRLRNKRYRLFDRSGDKRERHVNYCRAYRLLKQGADPTPGRPKPDVCEMCGGPPTAQGMCFDHDHTTGKFRGWLCSRCNTGLGSLGDQISVAIERLQRYLQLVGKC